MVYDPHLALGAKLGLSFSGFSPSRKKVVLYEEKVVSVGRGPVVKSLKI